MNFLRYLPMGHRLLFFAAGISAHAVIADLVAGGWTWVISLTLSVVGWHEGRYLDRQNWHTIFQMVPHEVVNQFKKEHTK